MVELFDTFDASGFELSDGTILEEDFFVAYRTWGSLSPAQNNVILHVTHLGIPKSQ